ASFHAVGSLGNLPLRSNRGERTTRGDDHNTRVRSAPAAATVTGSKLPAESIHAAASPRRVADATKRAASEVLPVLTGPTISLILPRTIPAPSRRSIRVSPELRRRSLRVSSRPVKTPVISKVCSFLTDPASRAESAWESPVKGLE